jgi:TetR/AcrR family transcriptional repressor of nem operon
VRPGPPKLFDPDEALVRARDVFWRRGYDGAGVSELAETLGVGRKSLYDTFGSKRALFLRALESYTDTVIERICGRLEHPEGSAIENLERALRKLAAYHASGESDGCLLGVAMAQADRADTELAQVLRGYLQRLERAFEGALARAQKEGDLAPRVRPKDAARHLVALTQGMALLGRVSATSAVQRSIVRSALDALRA